MFYERNMLRALFLLMLSAFIGRRFFAQGGRGVIVRVPDPDASAPGMSAMPCLRTSARRADIPTTIDPAFLPPPVFGIGFLRA